MTRKLCVLVILIVVIISISICVYSKKSVLIDEATNKSLPRNVDYPDDQISSKTPVFHLSIDDFIDAFEDITLNQNDYETIFENTTFAWMQKLHEEYGAVFSCYVYYEKPGFDLSMVTHKYRNEFEENSDWLRFGFHTFNGNTIYSETDRDIAEDYSRTIMSLTDIVSDSAIDHFIRLQSFQGTKKQIIALKNDVLKEPVEGLLTADDGRQSYYLNKKWNKYIYSHDYYTDQVVGISFISTDIRAEKVADIGAKIEEFSEPAWNNQLEYLVVFTHEWAIDDLVKENIREFCRYAVGEGYQCCFFEDICMS